MRLSNKQQVRFKETEIGLIPDEWTFESLKNHAEIIMGQSPESTFYNNNGDGLVFLQGIRTFGEKYPIYDTYTTKITKKAKIGSVLLSVRAPVGEVNIATKDICIGRGLMAINSQNNEFIYQLFKAFKEYVVGKETGTVYGSVTRDDISNLKLPFPPLLEQQKIAEILSSLDDKIELNRKINDNLEKIASALFRRWFVDFEFPDKDGKPYKPSGGKMIESELGDIPEGWLIKDASDLLDFVKGVEPGAKQYSEEKFSNYIDFFRVADIYNGRDSKVFINKNISKNIYTSFNDVLITTDGTVGRVATGLEGVYSGGIRKVLSKNSNINNSFIYFWLKSEYVQNILQEYASDSTTIAHASGAIRGMKIIFNYKIFDKFSSLTEDIFNNILNNLKEIKNLEYIRDSLLPRLMNGKIRV